MKKERKNEKEKKERERERKIGLDARNYCGCNEIYFSAEVLFGHVLGNLFC